MKSGISLVDMAKEIQRQADLKADYMLDTRSLRLEPFDSKLYLNAYDQSGVPALEPPEVNSIAHRQIGTHLKIPAAYYDKMLEKYPQLLAQNVNAWFQREPSVRMIRTIEGTARAFLSNRYRRIDNLDIASIVLPVLQDMEGMHFESCQLTKTAGGYTLTVMGETVTLTAEQSAKLAAAGVESRSVTAGVRPVHISLGESGIPAEVDVSELMGSELHLHLAANGQDVVAVIPTANIDPGAYARHTAVKFGFDAKLVHLFDSDSEKNLI